ncbi:ATP-grasp domain-containing protein [Flavivirga amylovorans]|uniref:ATP-grasp domain-containing protein n=1 Tax=Flavivirga amylovorans TaxID=870486 RepID=A0ABT8X1W8_9FLAO|nr:ATP-grasp domain-containing protein [Flavivirga amylovorans]MDO5987945.1 ATP-grasp domain-containing protein [Flavivirga amylovorans]
MSNILITSGGRRVSLVKAFKNELTKVDPSGKVFVVDALPSLSAASQISDKAFKICEIEDPAYIDALLKICIENNVSLIIPTLDTELSVLAKNKKKFLKFKIQLVLSSKKLIKKCNNKLLSQSLFNKLNIEVPKVYSKDNYKLPIFIKPINGSGSDENYIVKSEDQISKYHKNNNLLYFFEYLNHDDYDEYTCDLYYDKSSILKCVIPRKRIEIRGGEVSKGVTKKNQIIPLIESNFKHLKGARGCITVQLFLHKTNKNLMGIEVNPRFGGGYPLSYLAGGNYPKWLIQEYLLNEELNYYNDWEENLLMLRYDNEVLVHSYEN